MLASLLVEDFLSLQEQEDYPTASHKKSFINLILERDRNFYNDFTPTSLVSKLKFSESRKNESYKTNEVEKVKQTIKRRSSR